MIPKKPKTLYKQLAEDENIDEQLIEDLITFYYRKVRQDMSALAHTRIHIDGLGQFVVKSKAVTKLIDKYTRQVASLDGYSIASYHHKIRLETRLEELNRIAQVIEEEKQVKDNFKKAKNESTKGNLEEPEADNGRS
jgi:nucleoid DNA-binding protein